MIRNLIGRSPNQINGRMLIMPAGGGGGLSTTTTARVLPPRPTRHHWLLNDVMVDARPARVDLIGGDAGRQAPQGRGAAAQVPGAVKYIYFLRRQLALCARAGVTEVFVFCVPFSSVSTFQNRARNAAMEAVHAARFPLRRTIATTAAAAAAA